MSQLPVVVENLGVEFETARGTVTALRGISFQLERGEVLGVVGESGSGKSVACHSIVRLLPRNARVTSGRVLVSGHDVLALSRRDLLALRGQQVAMIFQNPSTHLDPLMTVGDQIGEALRHHLGMGRREARHKAIELLADVRIADPERRVTAFPHELSGGMKQRVMIAAALACEPQVLIADEPTTALDVTVQASILELLKGLRDERGLSIVLVSHDLGVVADICDRVVVMKDGVVVESGARESVLFAPQADYTKRLIAAHPELGRARERIAERQDREAPTALLRVEGLTVEFQSRGPLALLGGHRVKAVDDVSFELLPGDTLGLVGESGSGKSTVARALVGLVRPTAGKVLYRGKPLAELRGDERLAYRRAVQMVFQDPYTSLNPRLTVAETLAEPLLRHGLQSSRSVAKRVLELMEAVELSPALRNRRPHQLSGGQRQRVGIARALSLEPEVLVADEITSALDVTIQAQILELLRRLREEMSLTVLFISHDLGVVDQVCADVAVMSGGRIVERGPSERILANPEQEYTRRLLAAVPRMYPLTPGRGAPAGSGQG
jgi:ABC-type glutathione transport system ATPase component